MLLYENQLCDFVAFAVFVAEYICLKKNNNLKLSCSSTKKIDFANRQLASITVSNNFPETK